MVEVMGIHTDLQQILKDNNSGVEDYIGPHADN
jgi:hypothetical protein